MTNSLFLRVYLTSLLFFFLFLYVCVYLINAAYEDSPDDISLETRSFFSLVGDDFIKAENKKEFLENVNRYQSIYEVEKLSILDLADEIDMVELKKVGDLPLDRENIFQQVFWVDSDDYVLAINTEKNFKEWTFIDYFDEYYMYLLVFLTLGLGLFAVLRLLTKPMRELAHSFIEFGHGNHAIRADENQPKPINMMAKQFNAMAESIGDQMEQQRIMIGAIPHELRTPLSHIRFALDLTKTGSDTAHFRKYIEQIDGYADDMQQVIDETIELIKLQSKPTVSKNQVSVNSILDGAMMLLDTDGKTIVNATECEYLLRVNETLMIMALRNVLANAIRYAKNKIKIHAKESKEIIEVIVDDDGPGIPVEARELVLMPFSKLSTSRNQKEGSIGLGLSMVKLIADKHNGEIMIVENEWGGARVVLSIPKA